MIRITIELVPFGIESHKKLLGQAIISNNLTGTRQHGNYGYALSEKDGKTVLRQGYVNGFPRLSKDVWHLLKCVLDDALEDGDG